MAVIYVDPLNGTDNGDAGRGETDGTSAYASIAYALANYGSFATTASNTIYLADTSADVLTSSLDTDTTVAKSAARLAIIGYHYDGSNGGTAGAITGTLPWGRTAAMGEIDGNDAVASLFDGFTNYTTVKNIKLHSTTSYVLSFSTLSNIISCEAYNGTSNVVFLSTATAKAIDTYIYNDSDLTYTLQSVGLVEGCEIKTGTNGIYKQGGDCRNTLIHDFTDAGIICVGSDITISNCTIDGTGANSSARGIENFVESTAYTGHIIINNLLTNLSGGTAYGIFLPSVVATAMIGSNAYYNCSTDSSYSIPAIAFGDVTESSDPYTASASDDYSLVSGANSNDAAVLTTGGVNENIGAWQEKPTGGGGGGAENVTIW